METKERIVWIDIAKGLGILLVILGHCVFFGGLLHNIIFSFHMPLFFVLSGIVFKEKRLKYQILKKTKSLILPYLIFFIIGIFVSLMIPKWRETLTAKNIMKDLYLGNPDNVNISSIWFLICLFWVIILYNILCRFNIKVRWVFIVLLLLIGLVFSYIDKSWLPIGRLPLDIDVAFMAIFFFAIGKELTFILKYRKPSYIIMAIILFAISVLLNGTVNLHGLIFNNPFLYIIESISGSYILMYISIVIESKNSIVESLLSWFGRNTIYILGLQAIGVRLYILVLNEVTKSKYVLYKLPLSHQVICFACVTMFSVAMVQLINIIKKKGIVNG